MYLNSVFPLVVYCNTYTQDEYKRLLGGRSIREFWFIMHNVFS